MIVWVVEDAHDNSERFSNTQIAAQAKDTACCADFDFLNPCEQFLAIISFGDCFCRLDSTPFHQEPQLDSHRFFRVERTKIRTPRPDLVIVEL